MPAERVELAGRAVEARRQIAAAGLGPHVIDDTVNVVVRIWDTGVVGIGAGSGLVVELRCSPMRGRFCS